MKTGTRLDGILVDVERRARERRERTSLAELRREVRPDPSRGRRFVGALKRGSMSLIAECKRRSPSAGTFSTEVDLLERGLLYASGGASALSILTEEDHFAGGLGDLRRMEPTGLPRLRKDFLLDEGMVLESAACGAEAILLLAICLPGTLLAELRELAGQLGLAVLLEVHDEAELERALDVEPDCIGVNARDLKTFHVDLATVERLMPRIPASYVRVAESGLRTIDDLVRVRAAGADAGLIGEALMRAEDPARTLADWRKALDA